MDLCQVVVMECFDENTTLYVSDLEYLETKLNPKEILDKMCLLQGSSMKGRVESFKYVMNVQMKIPVLVSLHKECIFFPLHGSSLMNNVWLQYRYIDKLTSLDTPGCIVHFTNGFKMEFDVGARVVYRQMRRCRNFIQRMKSSVYSGEIIMEEVCYNDSGDVNE